MGFESIYEAILHERGNSGLGKLGKAQTITKANLQIGESNPHPASPIGDGMASRRIAQKIDDFLTHQRLVSA
jgi:hypothetical protein